MAVRAETCRGPSHPLLAIRFLRLKVQSRAFSGDLRVAWGRLLSVLCEHLGCHVCTPTRAESRHWSAKLWLLVRAPRVHVPARRPVLAVSPHGTSSAPSSLGGLVLALLHLRRLLLLRVGPQLLDLSQPILGLDLRPGLQPAPLDVLRLHRPMRLVRTLDPFKVRPRAGGESLGAPVVASRVPALGFPLRVIRPVLHRLRNLSSGQGGQDLLGELRPPRVALGSASAASLTQAAPSTASSTSHDRSGLLLNSSSGERAQLSAMGSFPVSVVRRLHKPLKDDGLVVPLRVLHLERGRQFQEWAALRRRRQRRENEVLLSEQLLVAEPLDFLHLPAELLPPPRVELLPRVLNVLGRVLPGLILVKPYEVVECLAPLVPVLRPVGQAYHPNAVARLPRPLQHIRGLLGPRLELVVRRRHVVVEQLLRAGDPVRDA